MTFFHDRYFSFFMKHCYIYFSLILKREEKNRLDILTISIKPIYYKTAKLWSMLNYKQ